VSEEFEIERRELERPEKRVAKGMLFIRLKLDRLGKLVFESVKGIIGYAFLLAIFAGLIYWSIYLRQPEITSNLALIAEKSQLEAKLYEQKSNWSEEALNEIDRNIVQAEAKTFESFSALADWLNDKNEYAKALNLKMTYSLKEVSKTDIPGTFSLPIEIRIATIANMQQKSYIKAMEFTRRIINEHQHLEIRGAEISGDGKSLSRFNLDINLWIKDPSLMLSWQKISQQKQSVEGVDVPLVQ